MAENTKPEPDPTPEPDGPGLDPETEGTDPASLGRGPQYADGQMLPNVHQAIAHAMALVRAVGKWGQNKDQGYAFRSIDHFMTALNPAMAKAGVHVVPKVLQRIVDDSHVTGGGKVLRWVDVEMRFRFYGPDGSHVDAVTWGEARDSSDKATNKAMTGAFKYAIMQTFMVPTQDLQDADQESPQAEPAEQHRQEARADRRQSERQQARQQPRGLTPEELGEAVAAALQSATTKSDMGRRLAAIPGALVVEKAPGKYAYDAARLREVDVVLDKTTGDVVTAWEAVATFGAALPDEVHDDGPVQQPPANTHGPATRLGPDDPDPEGGLWEQEDQQAQQQNRSQS